MEIVYIMNNVIMNGCFPGYDGIQCTKSTSNYALIIHFIQIIFNIQHTAVNVLACMKIITTKIAKCLNNRVSINLQEFLENLSANNTY